MVGFNFINNLYIQYIAPVDQFKPKYLLKPFKPFFRNCRPLCGLVSVYFETTKQAVEPNRFTIPFMREVYTVSADY